jgi:ubiquinone/menaquinone biosynthesis C-methylase UbiE
MAQNKMNNAATVQEQYADNKNLNTRISIHDKYSTNKLGFGNWLYQQYQFFPGCRILELGCGTGEAWRGKLEQLGQGTTLILSDFSQGMVEEVKSKFSGYEQVTCEQINIENIPYEEETFDFVIANMMLYHVPDLNKGLEEVHRVLKKGASFYCATFGENGIQQYLTTTLARFGVIIDINGAFTLQNGADILQKHFPLVTRTDYIDSLEVTDTNDLLDYIASMASIGNIGSISRDELYRCFDAKKSEYGSIIIPKEYGMFHSVR